MMILSLIAVVAVVIVVVTDRQNNNVNLRIQGSSLGSDSTIIKASYIATHRYFHKIP